MTLILNEEELMLKSSAKEFLKEKSPVSLLRKLRDTQDDVGYDTNLWRGMAEIGWASLTIPEKYGGLGFGYVGLGQVLEESGRTLTASPLVATSLLCTTALQIGGCEKHKKSLFKDIMLANATYAFANEELQHHNPDHIETTAEKIDDHYVITGNKTFVLDGHVATHFIVSAKLQGEVHLFLVNAVASGIHKERVIMMDSRNSADIQFKQCPALDILSGGATTFHKTLDIGRIGLSAEMLGCTLEAFERTLAYIKERKQFGVAIGSFQALQHRAAKMFCEIELLKSIVLKALQAIDEGDEPLALWASMAKAKAGETIKLVTSEAIQMYGGIGMTDDEEIGFFIKRARVAQVFLGDYNFHLDRYAHLHGY
ncbi:acyl-CoA dehydrogenase family protein [Cyclobacteriaceae bacterium]|jgi:alkylation response protein AidB-like acyl-CoA dehydrogenase|nr:acyl-CoA dehydrogenase family protein [Cyclobacteriaceae bacterium]|tara:strand:- start:309 stop:1415 length:1107 start_codon:yes stop_codon:yes gene_type:complete